MLFSSDHMSYQSSWES